MKTRNEEGDQIICGSDCEDPDGSEGHESRHLCYSCYEERYTKKKGAGK